MDCACGGRGERKQSTFSRTAYTKPACDAY